jgi:hypothetical protein
MQRHMLRAFVSSSEDIQGQQHVWEGFTRMDELRWS